MVHPTIKQSDMSSSEFSMNLNQNSINNQLNNKSSKCIYPNNSNKEDNSKMLSLIVNQPCTNQALRVIVKY